MSSRMKKFHNKQFLNEKRSQRNQILYEHIERLLDIDNSKSTSSLKEENITNITRLERLFNNYELLKNNDNFYLNNNNSKLLNNKNTNKPSDNFISNDILLSTKKNSFNEFFKNNKIIKNKRFNLKFKYIVGIIFLINSIIIMVLIYNEIFS